MLLRHLVVVSLAACVSVAAAEDAVANNANNDQDRNNDLMSMVRALQYLNSQIQEEALKRLSDRLGPIEVQPIVVSPDDLTYAGSNEPIIAKTFIRGQRAMRNPLRFGKRESFRQPLRFGKRSDVDEMVAPQAQLQQQDKRLSAVRNPLRFGKRADIRQPLRFGKRLIIDQLE